MQRLAYKIPGTEKQARQIERALYEESRMLRSRFLPRSKALAIGAVCLLATIGGSYLLYRTLIGEDSSQPTQYKTILTE